MKQKEVRTYYLEMSARPGRGSIIPPPNTEVRLVPQPGRSFYTYLYSSIGAQWGWVDRLLMSSDELEAILATPACEVYVLYCENQPAGLAELDLNRPDEAELAYFGLMKNFIGQGLGRFLLNWIVDKAWTKDIQRLWVHTCELDHPAALHTYQKAGFIKYKENSIMQRVPDEATITRMIVEKLLA